MMIQFSKIVSTIFHPLLIPSYVFAIVFVFYPNLVVPIQASSFTLLWVVIFFFTFLIPSCLIYILFKFQLIATIEINLKQDRYLPHLLSSIVYSSLTWFFYSKLNLVSNLYLLMFSMTLSMVLVTMINTIWKISAHSTAMGGFVAFFIFLIVRSGEENLLYFLILMILFSGLVMSSRIVLNIHTLLQVATGFFLGVGVGTSVLTIIF